MVRSRLALLLAGAAVAASLAMIALPKAHHAIDEITLPLRHEDTIRQQAAEKNLNPALIAGVIYAESKFRDLTSPAGARGYMQLTPDTAEFIAHKSGATNFSVEDLSNADINIRYGTYYLRYLMDRYGGNLMLALAAYNAGIGNVDKWVATGRERVSQWPFAETREYVKRVLNARGDYADTYARELGL